MTIIDGRTAFVGVFSIGSVYSGGSFSQKAKEQPGHGQKVPWHDTDLQIDGPVCGEFQHLFMDTWTRQKGQPVAPADYYPQITRPGDAVVRAIGGTPAEPYSQI